MNNSIKILIAPLDWGLGHATRCIPIIAELRSLGATVIVAGTETTNALIRQEFPSLEYVDLPPYGVNYAAHSKQLPLKIALQVPRLLRTIKAEHRRLDELIGQYQIDAVISDNRYGLYTDKVPCIFITHQLNIVIPQSTWLQRWVNQINHKMIQRFTQCWVPDEEEQALAGKLSARVDGINLKYIGLLSRFEKAEPMSEVYERLYLLSGPEPQRSLLEEKVRQWHAAHPCKALMVRGVLMDAMQEEVADGMTGISHLPAAELRKAILTSKWIICRSGYSTLMDLMQLRKSALLIPTPGQTEQEYLASMLSEKQWFQTITQDAFGTEEALDITKDSGKPIPEYDTQLFKGVLRQWLSGLNSL
ncbi:MAG: glycosyl transferase family 28 [Chitinophagaceae bacterium]|nr:glycosyl transferase family 28 [Chitinophagaceae bacterium]